MEHKNISELLEILQCPISGGNLLYNKEKNMFYSKDAKVFFPIIEGIPVLLIDSAIAEE